MAYTERPWDTSEQSNQDIFEGIELANDNFEYINANMVIQGIITVWWGDSQSVPDGWAICDGSNGTPDLRDKFVIGAGNSYNYGTEGGSPDAVVVSHTHNASTGSSGSHSHNGNTNNTGAHRHVSPDRIFTNLANSLYGSSSTGNGNRPSYSSNTNYSIPWTSTAGAHSHNINTNNTGSHTHNVSVESDGESGVAKNLPPYKALYWIMKL